MVRKLTPAERRGEALAADPGAVLAARWILNYRMLELQFRSGGRMQLPRAALPELRGVPTAALDDIYVGTLGDILNWPVVDIGFNVAGLVERVLGGVHFAAAFARRGGATKSPAKARASRANGRKGGRPRKDAAA